MKGRSSLESLIPTCVDLGIIVPEIEAELVSKGVLVATVKGTCVEGITEGLFYIDQLLLSNGIAIISAQINFFAGYHFPLTGENAPLIAKTDLGTGNEGLTMAMTFIGQRS